MATPHRALREWLPSLPGEGRDFAIEHYLGIETERDTTPPSSAPPGEHLIGYHASGLEPILRALDEVPVRPDDVFIDLGSGLGKVVMLTRLLTGATARGIELVPELVVRARCAAERLDIEVRFSCEDVRHARIDDGTVFFLYAPFTGPVLADVLERLRSLAQRRQIVVCTLGIELGQRVPWLAPRPLDHFWLSIYDSTLPNAAPRD